MHGRYHRYIATVRPWLWFLTRTADCRIFQDMTVRTSSRRCSRIIRRADFKFELTGTYRKWTYCVQYRETDFNFVSRLMEQEGIYYYFRHTDGHHTLVLTDSTSKHTPIAGYETLPFIAPEQLVRPELEHISALGLRARDPAGRLRARRLRPRAAERRAARRSKALPRGYTPSDYEVYDYPGRLHAEAGRRAVRGGPDRRARQRSSRRRTAATNARGLAVGSLFTLERSPARRSEPRVPGRCRRATTWSSATTRRCREAGGAELSLQLRRRCRARSSSGRSGRRRSRSCRGRRRRSSSGPAGEEIYTDKYGRVKVQFHWDRDGKKDENSSCWIRVSQPWAGKGWGAVSTPRIGQEVIVDFLEGDPDQPIITGRVYNAEQMPPYDLPANKTQTGIKTRSSQGRRPGQLQRDPVRGQEGLGAALHPRREEPGHRGRERRDALGRARSHEDDRPRRDDARQARSDRDGRQQRDDHGPRQPDGDGRQERDDHDSHEPHRDGRRERDDHDRRQPHHHGEQERNGDRGAAAHAHASASTRRSASARRRRSPSAACRRSPSARCSDQRRRESDHDVGGNQSNTIGKDQATTVGANQSTNVGSNATLKVGGSVEETVAGNHTEKVSKSFKVQVGEDGALDVAKNLNLVAGEQIVIKTGDARSS